MWKRAILGAKNPSGPFLASRPKPNRKLPQVGVCEQLRLFECNMHKAQAPVLKWECDVKQLTREVFMHQVTNHETIKFSFGFL